VYGLDLISATDASGDQFYYTYDGLGSVTDVTDDTGAPIAQFTYDAFGAIRSTTGSSPDPWRFTGEQYDAASGLYFLRARYYDPGTGRFLGRDPIMAGHAFAYAENSPTNLIDPSGLGCPTDPRDCLPSPPDPRDLVDSLIELLPEGTAFQIGPYHISYQLIAPCGLYRQGCAAAGTAFPVSNALAYSTYSSGELREGTKDHPKEGDAFQHCAWSGMTTLLAGAHAAEQVTTHYEATGPSNPTEERSYDIENNKRGREFAQTLSGSPASFGALYTYCSNGRIPGSALVP
jgi:RHS repeat-associated protein